jgi:hypothetical protein
MKGDIQILATVECEKCGYQLTVELTETYTSQDHSWDDRYVNKQMDADGWYGMTCPMCLDDEDEENHEGQLNDDE